MLDHWFEITVFVCIFALIILPFVVRNKKALREMWRLRAELAKRERLQLLNTIHETPAIRISSESVPEHEPIGQEDEEWWEASVLELIPEQTEVDEEDFEKWETATSLPLPTLPRQREIDEEDFTKWETATSLPSLTSPQQREIDEEDFTEWETATSLPVPTPAQQREADEEGGEECGASAPLPELSPEQSEVDEEASEDTKEREASNAPQVLPESPAQRLTISEVQHDFVCTLQASPAMLMAVLQASPAMLITVFRTSPTILITVLQQRAIQLYQEQNGGTWQEAWQAICELEGPDSLMLEATQPEPVQAKSDQQAR